MAAAVVARALPKCREPRHENRGISSVALGFSAAQGRQEVAPAGSGGGGSGPVDKKRKKKICHEKPGNAGRGSVLRAAPKMPKMRPGFSPGPGEWRRPSPASECGVG